MDPRSADAPPVRAPPSDGGTCPGGIPLEAPTRGCGVPGPRHATTARPRNPVPRLLQPRPGGPRDDAVARGDLSEVPARPVPPRDALPMQLRAPERLLRDLLHVHVVPRHREGPLLEVPGGEDDPGPDGRAAVPRDDPRPREPQARRGTDRGLPRTAPLLRRLRELARSGRPLSLGGPAFPGLHRFEGPLESVSHGRPSDEAKLFLRPRHVGPGMQDVPGTRRLAGDPDRPVRDLRQDADHLVHRDGLAAPEVEHLPVHRLLAGELQPFGDVPDVQEIPRLFSVAVDLDGSVRRY